MFSSRLAMASANNPGERQSVGEQGFIEMLPDMALIEILSYLHATEVEKLAMISRRIRDLSLTRTATRNVNLSRCRSCTLSWLLDYMKSLSDVMRGSLDLSHNQWIPAKSLEKLTDVMTNITSLDVTGCCINEQFMHKVLSKATKLHSLAYTDRAFKFSSRREGSTDALSEASRQTLSQITHLNITFLTCSRDLSLVVFCPALTALTLDQHANTARRNCHCSFQKLNAGHFSHLKEYFRKGRHFVVHQKFTDFMMEVLKHLLANGTRLTKLIASLMENHAIARVKSSWASDLRHAELSFIDIKETMPSLCYLGTKMLPLKDNCKQFPNLQYLCFSFGSSGEMERHVLEVIPLLSTLCPQLRGLCIHGIHVHPGVKDNPVAQSLGKLKKLQYLSISPCAFEPPSQDNHSIFDTEADIEEKALALPNSIKNNQTSSIGKDILGLVQACPGITELELVYPQFSVGLTYLYESCMAHSDGTVPTDATLSALGNLKYLRRLTLGGALQVRHGTGFTAIFKECQQLSYLSLMDFGMRGQCSWMPAFCDALKYATSLQDLKIQHKNVDVSNRLLSSLQSCKRMRRICLISEKGRIEQPSCFLDLVGTCADLCLLVVCTVDSEAVRRKHRLDIRNMFKETRRGLCVVFGATEDLTEQEGREETLKAVPYVDLRELLLFKHHVCSQDNIK